MKIQEAEWQRQATTQVLGYCGALPWVRARTAAAGLLSSPSGLGADSGLCARVRKLTLTPAQKMQADAYAIFTAGWHEKALHDAIAITARMSFMQRFVERYGFKPMSREVARDRAKKRVKLGYVNLYGAFAKRAAS